MVRVLPVDVLRDDSQVGQQLVEHAAVIQEDQIEHQAQGGGGNHDGEEVQGPEQLGPHPYGVHQKGQDQGDAHLKDHGAQGQKHGVAQGGAELGVREQGRIVGIPGGVEALGRGPEAGDVGEAVQDVLEEGVVQEQDQKQERGQQEDHQRPLFAVQRGTHRYSLL